VVPVKPLAVAKQRLAPVLSPAERAELVEAMLRDVLSALDRSGLLGRTVVVTNDDLPARLAAAVGAEVRPDRERSYNALLAGLARDLESEGADSVAFVPADLPLLAVEDFDSLGLLDAGAPAVLLAQDRHGDGTNLLGLSPPTLFAPSYGPGSFARHSALAARTGARIHDATSPGVGLDVDTPDDLAELARRCETARPRVALATRAFLERTAEARAL
jgi:2-phospho-L-lactate guanylyltransferase